MDTEDRRIRLLMVDDEEAFLAGTSTALERRGFEVSTAQSGKEALRLAATHDYDVVILDMKMPELDGSEVFRRLKYHQQSLPVIILTGHGSVQDAFSMSKQGVVDYIASPVTWSFWSTESTPPSTRASERPPQRARTPHSPPRENPSGFYLWMMSPS